MAIDLYLIRHADALPVGPDVPSDEERPLSDKGREQCKALAAALQRGGVTLDVLLTSPLLRARQTAEGLLAHWAGPPPELQVANVLKPDAKPKKVKQFFLTLEGGAVGLVGHQPDLGRWIAWLIGDKKAQVAIAKAGVAKIECEDGLGKGRGVLTLLLPPAWFGS